MTTSPDLPGQEAGSTEPRPGTARPHGRRAAALLAVAAPLAVGALASAPVAMAFPTAAPPASAHATAALTHPDCLSRFGTHLAPKYPACLGD
jgi:hypothetical protein